MKEENPPVENSNKDLDITPIENPDKDLDNSSTINEYSNWVNIKVMK